MSAGDVMQWASELIDPLEKFQGQMSPIESQYMNTWQSFQATMNDLLHASGSEAFTGQAATAMQNAFNECVATEQEFQGMDIMGRAGKACDVCARAIEEAIASTSPRMVDSVIMWAALRTMDPNDIAAYGKEMVPYWLLAVRQVGASEQKAMQTLNALGDMADQLKAAVSAWNSTISAMNHEHWPKIAEWYERGRTVIELGGKVSEKFGQLLERFKGAYVLAGVSFLLDMVTGDEKLSWRNFDSHLIGTALSVLPGVDVVALTGAAINTGAPLLAWGQDQFAHTYSQGNPELEKQLKEPADGIREGGEKVNVMGVLNDLGAAAHDLTGGNPYFPLLSPSFSKSPSVKGYLHGVNDLQKAVVDTGSTLAGAYQVGLNTVGAAIDDNLVQHGGAVGAAMVPKINKVLHWLGG